MDITRKHLTWLALTLAAIFIFALFGPEEAALGAHVRLVYLHGAWVLTAEAAFAAAAAAGLIGLLWKRADALAWSAAFGRTGLVFWVTYLPLSLWAMQANWNGLFLAEPRFRLALTFAVVGLLLQTGFWLLDNLQLTALGNLLFAGLLFYAFTHVENIMHPPPSPIFKSGNWTIMLFFIALNLLTWLAAWLVTRWWLAKGN